jgi:hypothetical protein
MNYSLHFDKLDPGCMNLSSMNLKRQWLNAVIVKASLYVAEDNGGNTMSAEKIAHIVGSCKTDDMNGVVLVDDSDKGVYAFVEQWKQFDPLFQKSEFAKVDAKDFLGTYGEKNVECGKKIWKKWQEIQREIKKEYLTAWSEATLHKNYTPSGNNAQDVVRKVLKSLYVSMRKPLPNEVTFVADEITEDNWNQRLVNWRPSYWFVFLRFGPPGGFEHCTKLWRSEVRSGPPASSSFASPRPSSSSSIMEVTNSSR